MKDGEKRTIRPVRTNLPFEVVAYRVDDETPYIILKNADVTFNLTDTEAYELLARVQKAVNILPSSK